MSATERYLDDLDAALQAGGHARRRFLRECRDHLACAAAEHGETDAVRAFGPPREIAAAFDAEVAGRRGVRATALTVAGVLALGGSTLALIHAAAPAARAPVWWTLAFFVAAQVAGVAGALAALQALALRRAPAAPADVMLLARRNACALLAAALTMVSAGAAVSGHGSAPLLLAGPALAVAAAVAVLRTRAFARRLDGAAVPAVREPLEDLGHVTGLPLPAVAAARLLPLATALAAAAAFARDRRDEHAAVSHALATAGVEAAAVLACFLVLGRVLGLRHR